MYYIKASILALFFFNNQHNVAISRCSKCSVLSIGCLYVIIITTHQKKGKKKEKKKGRNEIALVEDS